MKKITVILLLTVCIVSAGFSKPSCAKSSTPTSLCNTFPSGTESIMMAWKMAIELSYAFIGVPVPPMTETPITAPCDCSGGFKVIGTSVCYG
jgi:hypothetical protein